jgi:hypothetical protein
MLETSAPERGSSFAHQWQLGLTLYVFRVIQTEGKTQRTSEAGFTKLKSDGHIIVAIAISQTLGSASELLGRIIPFTEI